MRDSVDIYRLQAWLKPVIIAIDTGSTSRVDSMLYAVEEGLRRQAKFPHELFMLNLAVFHLLMAPAAIVLKIGTLGFLIPLLASLSVIGFTYLRSHQTALAGPWFLAAHWRIAARRSRILIAIYAVSGAILLVGLLLSLGIDKKTTRDIMITVFSRIAVVPILIAVMVCFVLESGAIYQAGRGEVPDGLLAGFPPPAELKPIASD